MDLVAENKALDTICIGFVYLFDCRMTNGSPRGHGAFVPMGALGGAPKPLDPSAGDGGRDELGVTFFL